MTDTLTYSPSNTNFDGYFKQKMSINCALVGTS